MPGRKATHLYPSNTSIRLRGTLIGLLGSVTTPEPSNPCSPRIKTIERFSCPAPLRSSNGMGGYWWHEEVNSGFWESIHIEGRHPGDVHHVMSHQHSLTFPGGQWGVYYWLIIMMFSLYLASSGFHHKALTLVTLCSLPLSKNIHSLMVCDKFAHNGTKNTHNELCSENFPWTCSEVSSKKAGDLILRKLPLPSFLGGYLNSFQDVE